jgi:hypothetical protein
MLPAGIGYIAGCRLVTVLVGSRGRVGLVTPTPNAHLPALFGGPFHVQLGAGGVDFCPLDTAVGVNPVGVNPTASTTKRIFSRLDNPGFTSQRPYPTDKTPLY